MEDEPKLPGWIKKYLSLTIFFIGVSLYLGWSIMYNTWTDVGLYAISIPIIGGGLAGYFLYSLEEEDQ